MVTSSAFPWRLLLFVDFPPHVKFLGCMSAISSRVYFSWCPNFIFWHNLISLAYLLMISLAFNSRTHPSFVWFWENSSTAFHFYCWSGSQMIISRCENSLFSYKNISSKVYGWTFFLENRASFIEFWDLGSNLVDRRFIYVKKSKSI